MKKLLSFLPALLLVFAFQTTTQAQTAEEIVESYIETIGGAEKMGAVKNVKMTMKAKAQGMDLPVVMYQAAPNKQRMDMTFQGKTMTQMSFDGETGWGVNFMTMESEKWDQEQSDMMKGEMDFPDSFYNYANKGYKVSLEGEETIDGTACHKIKLTKKPVMVDGEEEENFSYYFFDKETNVPIMVRSYGKSGQMKGVESELYMSDYQEVDGIYFAHSMTQKAKGQTMFSSVIETIEINSAEVNDDLFTFPGDKKSAMDKLQEAVKASDDKEKEEKAEKKGKMKKSKKKKKKK